MPKISVIVPIYKVDSYLAQCLDSIVAQTFEDLEILLVDEGDMDRCRDIIDDYAAHDPRIIAMHDKHGGYGNSVNAGIEAATGDYIAFVESDDFIEPYMFEALYEKAQETGAEITKSSFYYYFDGKKEGDLAPYMLEIGQRLPVDRAFSPKLYPDMFAGHPSIWTGLYKADWLKASGIRFLPRGAYLDIKFRFDVLMATDKFAWVNLPLYYWRLTNPTSTNAVWNFKAGLERWTYIHEYFADKPELWSRMAPIFIAEEYNNIFMRLEGRELTDEQREKIVSFRALYSEESIRNSIYIGEAEKDHLLNQPLFRTGKSKLRRTLNLVADKLDDDKRKWRVCVTTLAVLILYYAAWSGWYRDIFGSINDTVTDIFMALSFIVVVLFVLYWGALIGLRTLQDIYNVKYAIHDMKIKENNQKH